MHISYALQSTFAENRKKVQKYEPDVSIIKVSNFQLIWILEYLFEGTCRIGGIVYFQSINSHFTSPFIRLGMNSWPIKHLKRWNNLRRQTEFSQYIRVFLEFPIPIPLSAVITLNVENLNHVSFAWSRISQNVHGLLPLVASDPKVLMLPDYSLPPKSEYEPKNNLRTHGLQ